MTRRSIVAVASMAWLLASCSEAPSDSGVAPEAAEVASADGAPDVRLSAAPGVAFDYRYAYRLPDRSISLVLEAHAAACEKLGLARCRISGMRYSVIDEDRVEATLDVRLDPSIARNFGKNATATVEQAEGALVDAQIEGSDVGTGIAASRQRSADTQAEIGRIEARLAEPALGDRERTELRQQIERLRIAATEEQVRRSDDERLLATTPMHFSYSGADGLPGFARNPFESAWKNARGSFVMMTTVVMTLLAVLLPWAVLAALVWVLWRSPLGAPIRRLHARSGASIARRGDT